MSRAATLPFEKISATGNRFLFVQSAFLEHFETLQSLRDTSIEACKKNRVDGLVFWHCEGGEAPSLLILNSDGSLAGTCGNALRAFAFLLRKRGVWENEKTLRVYRQWNTNWNSELRGDEGFASMASSFATLEKAVVKNPIQGDAQISMGAAKRVETVATPQALATELSNFMHGTRVEHVVVEIANPHWVFVSHAFEKFGHEDFINFGKAAQGKLRELTSTSVPLSNIGMCLPTSDRTRYLHTVYERGAGLTQCCGSGAVAARIALAHLSYLDSGAKICEFEMPGGSVQVLPNGNGFSLSGNVKWEEEGSFASSFLG